MLNSINPTELAHIELEFTRMQHALTRTIPPIDELRARRLTYFLIETRRAAYGEAHVRKSLKEVLDQFDVGYDAYYDWREKWYLLLPAYIKIWCK